MTTGFSKFSLTIVIFLSIVAVQMHTSTAQDVTTTIEPGRTLDRPDQPGQQQPGQTVDSSVQPDQPQSVQQPGVGSELQQPQQVVNSPYQAYFEPDNFEPRLGEPVDITLVVNVPPANQVEFPPINAEWGEFTIVSVGEVTFEESAENIVYSLPMQVIPWETGLLETPETRVRVTGAGVDEQVRVESFLFEVPSLLEENPALIVSRNVLGLPYPLSFWITAGGVVAVISGGAGVYFYVRSGNQRGRFREQRVVPRTLTQRTVNRLNQIRSEAPDMVTQYANMGDTLRVFIRDLFDLPATDMTTVELMDLLSEESVLPEEKHRSLGFLLEQADLAKFAPAEIYTPGDLSLLKVAVLWVQDVGREATE